MAHAAEFSPTGLLREVLASRSDRAQAALETRLSHSWKMALDRGAVLSDRTDATGTTGLNVFLRSGHGAQVTDIDGAVFTDFCMGFGTQILGHNHPAITTALVQQMAQGWQLGLPTAPQLDFARLIQAAGPANERIALCANGSDATLLAMRAARAVTGKDGIAVFAGSTHGVHDYGFMNGEADAGDSLRRKFHLGAGIPQAIDHVTTVLPYGHPAAFDRIRHQRHDLAAVIVEAVRGDDPHLDAGPWLKELAAVCRYAGILLILDESTTGFRLAYGGAQEVFGLQPDLVTYGQSVGGGLPLGVVAGRADLMAVFSGHSGARSIFAANTFSGNSLSVAAGAALLQYLSTHRGTVYPTLEKATALLADGVTAVTSSLGIPASLRRAGSIFRIVLGTGQTRNGGGAQTAARSAMEAFSILALDGGVLLQAGLRGFVSTAHDDGVLQRTLSTFATVLQDMKADGLFPVLSRQ